MRVDARGAAQLYDYALVRDHLDRLYRARKLDDRQQMAWLLRSTLHRDLGGMGSSKLFSKTYFGTRDLIEQYVDEASRAGAGVGSGGGVKEVAVQQGKGKVTVRWSGQVVYQLNYLAMEPIPGMTQDEKINMFVSIRQAFGRSALLLSGGGGLGIFHFGVLKCLHEQKLLPRILSGSSVGSLVAALICTTPDDELASLLAGDVPALKSR
jgi:hypothetical protein